MGLAAKVFTSDAAERRISERRPVDRSSTVRDRNRSAIDVIVSDISETGCAIETPTELPIGSEVTIGLAGVGTCTATITRRSGNLHGCEFARPIDPTMVQLAFTQDTVVAGPFSSATIADPSLVLHEPMVEKWPPAARIALIGGSSLLLWGAIVALAF